MFPGADPGPGERAPPAGPAPSRRTATGRSASGASGPTCGSWPPRDRRGRARTLRGRSGAPHPSLREGLPDLCADARGRRRWKRGLGEQRKASGAERSPETLRSPRPLPLAHSASRAPGSLDLPLLPGHAPRPRLAQCPSWANFLTPSGEPLSLGPSRTGEGKAGGSGRGLLWKLPGVFETEVTGRRGPFGSCQGVLLSQNRTVLLQTLRSAVSALRSRLPHSAGCDRLGGGGEPGEVRVGAWEGVPGGDRGSTQERRPSSPTDPRPLTFDFCSPGEEGPHQSPRARRAPDSSAPAGRPSRAGAGRAGPCSSRIRPGLLHRSRLGQIRGFLLTSHPHPALCVRVQSPHPMLSWGHAEGGTASPLPCLPRTPVSQTGRVPSWTRLPAVLRRGQGERRGCCLRPHPAGVGRRFRGSPRSWGPAVLSAGQLRGPVASRFSAPFPGFNRIAK